MNICAKCYKKIMNKTKEKIVQQFIIKPNTHNCEICGKNTLIVFESVPIPNNDLEHATKIVITLKEENLAASA
jgi:hypothetical protein